MLTKGFLDRSSSTSTLQDERQRLNVNKTLIFDSIYCLVEIIRTRKVFGISYIHNHSNLANSHEKLGDWCLRLNQLFSDQVYSNVKKNWIKELEELVNRESLRNLDAEYHYDQAFENYYSSIKMHTENESYRHNIQNMNYLEDDFDDELVHFCGALERLRLNNGYIYQKIVQMKDNLRTTNIHDINSFAKLRI